MTTTLSTFDGRDVIKATIAVTNAGDGLSDALKVDPQEFSLGDKVYVVLETEVAKIRFEEIKDTDALARVHVLKAGNATIVDGTLVAAQIAEQAERIRLAKEAEQGVQRLDFAADDARLSGEHDDGAHDEPVLGCPKCEAAPARDGDTPDDDTPSDGVGEFQEDPERDVLFRHHMAGRHAEERVPGCPTCDDEAMKALMGADSGVDASE